MQHEEVYKQFKQMFPQYSKHTSEWFQNGKDSIRVRIHSGSDFIFTYHAWDDWCFETVGSFIKRLRGNSNKEEM